MKPWFDKRVFTWCSEKGVGISDVAELKIKLHDVGKLKEGIANLTYLNELGSIYR